AGTVSRHTTGAGAVHYPATQGRTADDRPRAAVQSEGNSCQREGERCDVRPPMTSNRFDYPRPRTNLTPSYQSSACLYSSSFTMRGSTDRSEPRTTSNENPSAIHSNVESWKVNTKCRRRDRNLSL